MIGLRRNTQIGLIDYLGLSVVGCNDLGKSGTNLAVKGVPQSFVDAFKVVPEPCMKIPGGPHELLDLDGVHSDVPVLMLEGKLDPVTPPRWGRIALNGLHEGRMFVFERGTHGFDNLGKCSGRMVEAFIATPRQARLPRCNGATEVYAE